MSSNIYYRFNSQRESTKITFDGIGGTSVFDIKRQIILNNKLVGDFNIFLLNPNTGEEYKDDSQLIGRSTSVIVKRLPSNRPGRGNSARYLSENAKIRSNVVKKATVKQPVISGNGSNLNEEDAIKTMMAQTNFHWEQAQTEMAHIVPKRSNYHNVPTQPLPPGYVCYRCGQKGHWIQQCPTNDDPEFDGRKRVRRTTGIPKAFLKAVVNTEDSNNVNVLINAEGEYVQAVPDIKAWESFKARNAPKTASDVFNTPLNADHQYLACGICSRLVSNPTRTPCCSFLACYTCLSHVLLDNDFVCIECQQKNVALAKLVEDKETRAKVETYINLVLQKAT